MTLSDRIELQTRANGSKLVRVPADELLALMKKAEAADMDKLAADAWRRHCREQNERRKADRLARAIIENNDRKDRV